jgi:glucose-6-phosphate isomerase
MSVAKLDGRPATRAPGNIRALFAEEPNRAGRLSARLGALWIDASKQDFSAADESALLAFAESCVPAGLARLFDGAEVNASEKRPALHWLLRTPIAKVPTHLSAFAEKNAAIQNHMRQIVEAIHAGRAADVGLVQPSDVVNLGIGGSDLGPRLVVDALKPHCTSALNSHFIANVDGYALHALLPKLSPAKTLFIVASKSFNTHETLLNAQVARSWLLQNGVLEADIARHFLAVSANVAAAVAFGIRASSVLAMFDSVGGRYSLWSAVGLSAAIALGWSNFEALLAGAHLVDEHVRSSEIAENQAVRLALLGYHNGNTLGHATQAVISYDERLARFPEFLQQLEMESNGKGVTAAGDVLPHASSPVVWGGLGTNVQHAFFQAIHQGTQIVPIDFVGVINPDHRFVENHDVLLANLLAQSSALLLGKTFDAARAEIIELSGAAADALARQKMFPGNRPSTTILLDALTPSALGQLLALYEHKTYVLSLLLGVNCFDQWGVELGKLIANKLLPAVQTGVKALGFDDSTQSLLEQVHQLRHRY